MKGNEVAHVGSNYLEHNSRVFRVMNSEDKQRHEDNHQKRDEQSRDCTPRQSQDLLSKTQEDSGQTSDWKTSSRLAQYM